MESLKLLKDNCLVIHNLNFQQNISPCQSQGCLRRSTNFSSLCSINLKVNAKTILQKPETLFYLPTSVKYYYLGWENETPNTYTLR